MADPFEVLELPRHAGEGEIRKRYLELVRAFPPSGRPSDLRRCMPLIRRCATPLRDLRHSSSTSSATNDSIEALAADLRQRLRGVRLPVETLLSLADWS